MVPDSFIGQSALQTADSVSRGFLARRRCVLRPRELQLQCRAGGGDDAAAGCAAGVPPPAGASIVQVREAGVASALPEGVERAHGEVVRADRETGVGPR